MSGDIVGVEKANPLLLPSAPARSRTAGQPEEVPSAEEEEGETRRCLVGLGQSGRLRSLVEVCRKRSKSSKSAQVAL